MTTTAINKYEDIIDSRDVIERIEELREQRQDYISEATDPATGDYDGDPEFEWSKEYPEDAAELESLESLAEEAEEYCEDWIYGAPLIRYSYFTEYAIDMLRDCGELPANTPWYIEIDEEATANNIKQDYTSIEFDGVTYWIR